MIVENFLELVDIEDIILEEEYVNMVDISVDVDQSFLLSNGLTSHNSASSPFRVHRNQNTQGAFCLKGKFVNATDMKYQDLVLNEEVLNFMAAMGLRLGEVAEPDKLRYGKILIYTDADTDGSCIAALLINFIHIYWPELFEHKMVYRVETPLVVSINVKSKKKLSFYNQDEYNQWLANINAKEWQIEYKKGLAALSDDEYKEIIHNPRLMLFTADEESKETLSIWFGGTATIKERKNLLLQ